VGVDQLLWLRLLGAFNFFFRRSKLNTAGEKTALLNILLFEKI
jgi:hypothetical protein